MHMRLLPVLIFCFAVIPGWPDTPQEKLQQARLDLLDGDTDAVEKKLSGPFSDPFDEINRNLMLGLASAFDEEYEQAKTIFNNTFLPSDAYRYTGLFTLPENLDDTPVVNEYNQWEFSTDDMRYLWRILWQERIAHRFTKPFGDSTQQALALLDLVYRHTRFGSTDEGYIRDEPFYGFLRGRGYCEELAWMLNRFFHAARIDCARLILTNNDDFHVSPHTISMIRQHNYWIPLDPSHGIVLQHYQTHQPKGLAEIRMDANWVSEFGGYQNLSDSLLNPKIVQDHEWPYYALRFCSLRLKVEPLFPLPSLAGSWKADLYPMINPETKAITEFTLMRLSYVFDYDSKKRAELRDKAQKAYPHFPEIRPHRLAMLQGHYDSAITGFKTLMENESTHSDAKRDAAYYQAVCLYEQNKLKSAQSLFEAFLQKYPQSDWTSKAHYHIALIQFQLGSMMQIQPHLKACKQDHPGSLFNWITGSEYAIVKNQ